MPESKDKSEFSCVFGLGGDVLDFLLIEGDSWIYFDLRGLEVRRGVLVEPAVLDTEAKERAEAFKLFGGSTSPNIP